MSTELIPQAKPTKQLSAGTLTAIIIAIAAMIFSIQNLYFHLRNNLVINQKITVAEKTISQLQQNVDNLQNSKTLHSQRILSDVRYLVHLANLHLLIDHDASSALRILQVAQRTLSSTDNPAFSGLSQAMASDIAALQAAPTVDTNQTFLSLSTLIQQIQLLSPIPASPTISIEKTAIAMKSAGEQLPWHERIFASLKQLKGLFVIRHLDQPNTPIITADTEALIKQNMIMQLNMAQWALLHRNQKIYHQALQNVLLWLTQYFALTTQKDAIMTQLSMLEKIQIDAALPSIANTTKALSLLGNTAPSAETIVSPQPSVISKPKKAAPSNSTTPKSTPASVET